MSYRVLIVDDEILIREGLKKHIDWDALDLEVIGTAGSAASALRQCENCAPDILITDICMQDKDGFSLIEDLLEMGISPQVVLISSYDEFSYARKAIRLEVVKEYVLKPIDTDYLTTLLKNIHNSLDKGRRAGISNVSLQELNLNEYRNILSRMRAGGYDTHRLIQSIKSGDSGSSLAIFHSASSVLMEPEVSSEIVKRFCSGLLMSFFTDGIMNATRKSDPVELLGEMISKREITEYMTKEIFGACSRISRQNRTFKSKLIETCLKVIDEEYCNPNFNLTTMAAELNVTPNYLSVRFKEETGVGFVKYLLEKQMDRAKVLLSDPTIKIYEVSSRVGFEDEKYFSRQFKRMVGSSPKDYRNKHTTYY